MSRRVARHAHGSAWLYPIDSPNEGPTVKAPSEVARAVRRMHGRAKGAPWWGRWKVAR